MEPYRHTVQYYETDRMGIAHHSNYIRWMEEARVDFLRQLGWGYDRLEAEGIVSPVTALDCKYKATTTFPDVVTVQVYVAQLKNATLRIGYRMEKQDGQIAFEGQSEHCFLNREGRIVRLRREKPEFYAALAQQAVACLDVDHALQ